MCWTSISWTPSGNFPPFWNSSRRIITLVRHSLFPQAIANELKEWCKENNTDLYGDGLKIYTTLDSRLQQYAEEAVNRQMREVQKRFDAHLGHAGPWRDRNGEEIPRFIEELAEKTSGLPVSVP